MSFKNILLKILLIALSSSIYFSGWVLQETTTKTSDINVINDKLKSSSTGGLIASVLLLVILGVAIGFMLKGGKLDKNSIGFIISIILFLVASIVINSVIIDIRKSSLSADLKLQRLNVLINSMLGVGGIVTGFFVGYLVGGFFN